MASANYLRERFPTTRTTIVGFCMGGVIALHRTAGYANVFSAAAVWYGAPERASVTPEDVDIPIVASYGADDQGIPVDSVNTFFSRVSTPHDVKIYPNAGHAFFDDHGATYEQTAAKDSWRRTVTFLKQHLG